MPEPPLLDRGQMFDFETRLDREFAEFDRNHPEVYDELVRMARQLRERGHSRLSIAMLWETLRFATMLGAGPDESPWRLNNSLRSRYARKVMAQEPDLADVFETRALQETKPL